MKTIKPQLAQTAKEPFDHQDWLFELKLDGVRCIAYLDKDTRLQARNGQNITAQFPELQQLHRQVTTPCILDGEIACVTFNQVQHRIHRTKALDIRVAAKLYPARFFAFDLLNVNGKSLMPFAQIARKETLTVVMNENPVGLILPWQMGKGIALFREVQSHQQEGIMAKLKSAPYAEGKRVDWWLKIKNFVEKGRLLRGEGGPCCYGKQECCEDVSCDTCLDYQGYRCQVRKFKPRADFAREAQAAMRTVLGDDLDGLAAEIEDLGLT